MKASRVYDRYDIDAASTEVTRLNPLLAKRGYLIPGEKLYVSVQVPDRRIEREMLTLRDDAPVYEAPAAERVMRQALSQQDDAEILCEMIRSAPGYLGNVNGVGADPDTVYEAPANA